LYQGYSAQTRWNNHSRRDYGDAVTYLRQGNQGVRSRALQQDTSSKVRNVERGIEPLARSKGTMEQKQWLTRQVLHFEHSTSA
jgi:hypothetical protein